MSSKKQEKNLPFKKQEFVKSKDDEKKAAQKKKAPETYLLLDLFSKDLIWRFIRRVRRGAQEEGPRCWY